MVTVGQIEREATRQAKEFMPTGRELVESRLGPMSLGYREGFYSGVDYLYGDIGKLLFKALKDCQAANYERMGPEEQKEFLDSWISENC